MAVKAGNSKKLLPVAEAHRAALTLGVREVTRRLNASLGGTLVSSLAGASDTKASHKWVKESGPQPRPEAVKRLNFAYEQWQRVAAAEAESTSPASGSSARAPGWTTTPRSTRSAKIVSLR